MSEGDVRVIITASTAAADGVLKGGAWVMEDWD